MQHPHPLTPDSEPMTDQSTDVTRVQLGEPVHFTGVTEAETTQRQLYAGANPSKAASS